MIRGTTPTLTFTIRPKRQTDTIDLTEAAHVYLTILQGRTEIEKTETDMEITANTVEVWLTQEESLKLADGSNCDVQINWTYLAADGETVRRAATEVKTINIGKQLLKRVIE